MTTNHGKLSDWLRKCISNLFNISMKNLILIRHSKSSYDDFSSDKNRKCSEIGIARSIKVATAAKNYIKTDAYILSSTATRAAQTATIFSEIIPFLFDDIHFKDALYTFDSVALALEIKALSNQINTAVIFGHNPAFTDFINNNTNLRLDNLPTSGFVSIEFDTNNWNNLPKGNVVKTLFAKDL